MKSDLFQLEALEPRILLSADGAGQALSAAPVVEALVSTEEATGEAHAAEQGAVTYAPDAKLEDLLDAASDPHGVPSDAPDADRPAADPERISPPARTTVSASSTPTPSTTSTESTCTFTVERIGMGS